MCNDNMNNCNSCIADILKVILLLQNSVCGNDNCLQTCDRGFLGQNAPSFYNTRPIVLYTCGSNGTPLAMPISRDYDETTTSTVFRLEKLDECCATCRVLVATTDETTGTTTVTSTNSFFTIDLKSVCIIRCLDDVFVESV